jgi:SAM-dependent methyltransferase
MSEASRPSYERRADYLATTDSDYFILGLLRDRIDAALSQFGRPPHPGSRALDVGCGNQPFRKRLESMGYEYVGLDVQQNPAGTVDIISAIDQPLPLAIVQQPPFHLVLCTEVLEHIADWQTAFMNLGRLVAPGGHLIVTCPFFWPLHEEPHDYWRPTVHALDHFARAAGLSVLHLEPAGSIWDVLGTLLGNCSVAPARPGALNALLTRITNFVRRLSIRLLRSRSLERRVALKSTQGPIHLSTIGVMQLPAAGGATGR